MKSDVLQIGQKIFIPKNEKTSVKNDNLLYTVKKGDTLFMGNNEYWLKNK